MAWDRLRRYDFQASWAVALALTSVPPFLAAAYLVASRYQSVLGRIVYGGEGRFLVGFAAAALISLALAAGAFALGWNSAGQRRNDLSRRSWIAFFVGGSVLTLNVVLLIAFFMLRLKPQS